MLVHAAALETDGAPMRALGSIPAASDFWQESKDMARDAKRAARRGLGPAAVPPTTPEQDGPSPPPQPNQVKRTAASRWTDALIADGFTPVSNFFLAHGHRLQPELTHGEMMFVIHLLYYKWDTDMPRPGFKTIAKRMGIGHTRARALARGLEGKKYLARVKQRSKPNRFDLRPLYVALETLRSRLEADMKATIAKRKKPSVLQFSA